MACRPYLATNAPHGPYNAPPANAKRFSDLGFADDPAGFYGMIENIDENMGRLLNSLESMGLLTNTVVIFMSDNGTAGMKESNPKIPMGKATDGTDLFSYNAGMKGMKGSVDEGGVRVPFFVRWDGRIKANRTVSQVVAHIDVFPTIASLAGAELPIGQVEGRSLLPLIADAGATWEDRYLFDHTGRWPTGAEPDDHQWSNFTVRSSQYRLVDGKFLFDMSIDPGQTNNCIRQHPDVVEAMRSAYDKWWQETRPMMVNETAEMSPTRPFHEAFYKQQKEEGIADWK